MARKGAGQDRDAVRVFLDPGLALPRKRSLTIAGHRTSITLEDAFWR
ncbi:MAG: ribbon-helix-helix domain-containing protein [Rhodomicrobium sp.]